MTPADLRYFLAHLAPGMELDREAAVKCLDGLEQTLAQYQAMIAAAGIDEQGDQGFLAIGKQLIRAKAIETRLSELESSFNEGIEAAVGEGKEQIGALQAELETTTEDFKNACKQIDRMEKTEPYSRIAELEATINDLNGSVPKELSELQAENGRLREACEALKIYGGCFCEFETSQYTDYPMEDHSAECKKLAATLEGKP